MFDYDTKEKEHQNTRQSDLYSGLRPTRTNQIASCFDALSITNMWITLDPRIVHQIWVDFVCIAGCIPYISSKIVHLIGSLDFWSILCLPFSYFSYEIENEYILFWNLIFYLFNKLIKFIFTPDI
jgi:hypothetical protein